MKDTITLHRDFYDGIKDLPADIYKETCNAVLAYALDGVEIEIDGVAKSVFALLKPMLDKKGGAPAGNKNARKGKTKKKCGEYGHVLLTEEEHQRLSDEHPETIERAIKIVDEYCERTGKRYKNYNLAIRNWGIEAATQCATRSKPQNKIQAMPGRTYDYNELEKELRSI